MNTHSIKHNLVKVLGGMVAATLALGLVLTPSSAAQAAGLNDPSKPPTSAATNPQDRRSLPEIYAGLQATAARQVEGLAHTEETATNVQAFIDAQRTAGKDVSALETALTNFEAAVGTAQGQHAAAATVLATHAGFDDAGQVTDETLARQTVRDAGRGLKQAQQTLANARRALRQAIRAWRLTNNVTQDVTTN